jgi:hypothetical protein
METCDRCRLYESEMQIRVKELPKQKPKFINLCKKCGIDFKTFLNVFTKGKFE